MLARVEMIVFQLCCSLVSPTLTFHLISLSIGTLRSEKENLRCSPSLWSISIFLVLSEPVADTKRLYRKGKAHKI